MSFNMISNKDQDIGRGTALLASGAVMVLLKWVLPVIAPLAVAAYGIYRFTRKDIGEGLVALACAVLFYYLQGAVAWLLWTAGGLMVGFGLFFLIRALRAPTLLDQ